MKTMTKMEAQALARRLMQDHGVNYMIAFNNNKSRLGVCKHHIRTIEFSLYLMQYASFDEMVDTIKHEVAHVVVGPGHGHDMVWRATHRKMGGSGNARARTPVPMEASRYHVLCPVTEELINSRDRRSARLDRAICPCHRQPAIVRDTRLTTV